MVRELDAALGVYARVLREQLGADVADVPGAAPRGIGGGAAAFCGAEMRSGLDLAMELTAFDARIAGCRLAITGEGAWTANVSRQSGRGVARRARAAGVPQWLWSGAWTWKRERASQNRPECSALHSRPAD